MMRFGVGVLCNIEQCVYTCSIFQHADLCEIEEEEDRGLQAQSVASNKGQKVLCDVVRTMSAQLEENPECFFQ